MNCTGVRDYLWEADPAELAGKTESAVSKHLETCAECKTLATRMLNAQSVLDRALQEARPKTPVELALRAAALKAAAVRRRQRWWAAAPLAAAAGVAGLLLLGRDGSDLPGEMWQPQPAVVGGVDVEAQFGKDVVVFDIEDRPDVVVVWFFDKGDE